MTDGVRSRPVLSPPRRLAECGDTLSILDVCGVLGISEREFRRRRQHSAFPIQALPHLPNRFSKASVERFLNQPTPAKVWR